MNININVSDRFASFLTDWDYETYLLLGGYGSGKSYNVALKIILKLISEKRTALVVRNVKETIKESCFSLFKEVLENMDILSENIYDKKQQYGQVIAIQSPMEIRFPNGSRIIFRGMDKIEKIKSINGVSIVWIEECSEIKKEAYIELLGRIREPNMSLHFILTSNPVGKWNWVYDTFFTRTYVENDEVKEEVIQDEQEFYKRKTLINKKNGIYYHHSLPDDNPFLQKSYIKRLDSLKETDRQLWTVARWGRFGANGTRVLPNFVIAKNAKEFKNKVNSISSKFHFFGLDFGFEESFNALISCCVDDTEKILYIYDEVYINHITDDRFIKRDDVQNTKQRADNCHKPIGADSAKLLVLNHVKYWEALRALNTVA